MRILNLLIKESKEFGNELFGDEFEKNEPNTHKENEVLNSLKTFFKNTQDSIKDVNMKEIVKDVKLLFKNKNEFPELLKFKGKSLYRYTRLSNRYNYEFDVDKTLKSLSSFNGDNIKENELYLGYITNYGKNTFITSWSSKPKADGVMEFNTADSILLKTNDVENTVVNEYLSEFIKSRIGSFEEEFEVIKITNKKPETVDIVTYNNTLINLDFLRFFSEYIGKELGVTLKMNDFVEKRSNGFMVGHGINILKLKKLLIK